MTRRSRPWRRGDLPELPRVAAREYLDGGSASRVVHEGSQFPVRFGERIVEIHDSRGRRMRPSQDRHHREERPLLHPSTMRLTEAEIKQNLGASPERQEIEMRRSLFLMAVLLVGSRPA